MFLHIKSFGEGEFFLMLLFILFYFIFFRLSMFVDGNVWLLSLLSELCSWLFILYRYKEMSSKFRHHYEVIQEVVTFAFHLMMLSCNSVNLGAYSLWGKSVLRNE